VRILVSDQNFGDDAAVERELVAAAGGQLALADCADEEQVAAALKRHEPDALLVQFAPVGVRALEAAGKLRAIVRVGVGVDNIDTRAARAAGVAVARVPDYCVDEVADHTLALLLAVERRIVALAVEAAAGRWDFRAAGPMRRLGGRSLGLVGYGRIARAVGERARALGLEIAAHDPWAGDFEGAESVASLDDLLGRADVLSLHVPLTEETQGLIGRRELDLLPDDAVLLNTARGGLVDEEALAEALRSGRLRGAGLDVLAREPPQAGHPLEGAPNLVLTPHAAFYSEEAVLELRRRSVETAFVLLAGEKPEGLVVA
jgi:D-3-phosphoglycerate dehydrogenase / 2-oxoglutarate reductase